MYCDDLSLDYAFAQSVLFKVYGSTVQETGHKTKGMYINYQQFLYKAVCNSIANFIA